MISYTKSQLGRLIKVDFVRFCIVGGFGFTVNFILLVILHKLLGLPIFLSQLLSAEVALFNNFVLHHHWTYKANHIDKSITKLLVQFHASTWPAIIGSAVTVTLCEKLLKFSNLYALIVSSAAALLWNFAWSKYVIWRGVPANKAEDIIAGRKVLTIL